MKMTTVALTALLALPMCANAAYDGTGNDLIENIRAVEAWQQDDGEYNGGAIGYVKGLLRGVLLMANNKYFCVPAGSDTNQVMAIVLKYLNANPEKWHDPDGFLVVTALSEAWPCPE